MNVVLKQGREKSLLRRHPWIFSGAIHHADEPSVASGATVDLLSFNKQFLARASYSPHSQIRARVWTFEDEAVDKEFFRKRIHSAIAARSAVSPSPLTPLPASSPLGLDTTEQHRLLDQQLRSARMGEGDAMRLIYAESDGIPGLIVDRYGNMLVMQCLTASAEYWKDTFADLLLEETGLSTIYERSDADIRELEGLGPKTGLLRGNLSSLRPGSGQAFVFPITEHNLQFNINLETGHKTGFYLDQSRNRLRVREFAKDKDVLDCFCYTGGFTVNTLAGGAKSVISIDSSEDALALAKENIALNDLPADKATFIEGDVFQLLRKFRDENRSFDMIILDPPKFAPTAAQAERAARGYKDINLYAFKLLRPGGILVTFSCSGGIDAGLFQKIIAGAALDAGVEAQIVEHLSQGSDHPVLLHFPEGAYLKGLICYKPA
ncbi:MAG: class I SAM-dependent methyltransferase [Anaerolineae bacterium]|nr:class I SAM-dependent methyltransferase [Anaerolineae bacterium]MCI0610740.1 class I SAM-dependent methyltransferase [Anaerolineae bacterium]